MCVTPPTTKLRIALSMENGDGNGDINRRTIYGLSNKSS